MRILITGAAGEFGRDLTPWLAQRFNVRATDIVPAHYPCEFIQADLREPEQVRGLVEGIDAVIHLAVLLPKAFATGDFVDVNVKAVTLLWEAAANAGVSRMVYISTVWATGHGQEEGYLPVDENAPCTPLEMYGLTKLQGELSAEYFARVHGLSTVVLRMCGYARCPEFAPDGSVDLAQADLGTIGLSMISPGGKLYNPNDLGDLMVSAVTTPGITFERVIAGNIVPWQPADAAALATDPCPVIDRYFPGAADLFADYGIAPPPIPFWYSTRAAQRLLGLHNEYTLNDLIAAHRSR